MWPCQYLSELIAKPPARRDCERKSILESLIAFAKNLWETSAAWMTSAAALPATVTVAVVLFIARELNDWRKRYYTDKRKARALRRVLARETESVLSATLTLK